MTDPYAKLHFPPIHFHLVNLSSYIVSMPSDFKVSLIRNGVLGAQQVP